MSPRWGLTPRLTDWKTVSSNVTLILTLCKSYTCETYEATKRVPSAWGYKWVTLFLGDINTGTWPSRLGESRIWDSKLWSWVPRASDPRLTALARITSNCKRQTHPLVREDVTEGLWSQGFSWKKIDGRDSGGAWRKDELIGRKPPAIK
jgi:hypothetical protein